MNKNKAVLAVTGIALAATALVSSLAFRSSAGKYVAHEWGTFTSLQGSDGIEVQGLQHGDERLPNFVHCPIGGGHSYGGCLNLLQPELDSPLAVSQRLETPVIYFYSKQELDVNVQVDFPKGVFSEWYPAATSFVPQAANFTSTQNGTIAWDVQLKTAPLAVPPVAESSVWAPSRHVNSNYLVSNGENERFIFYRGIGRFTAPFRSTSDAQGNLTLANESPQAIPDAYLLQIGVDRGVVRRLGSIPAQGKIQVAAPPPLSDASPTLDAFVAEASQALKEGLVRSGLFDDEAQAMVDTWKRSYFQTPGVRVLYVTPREWTDQILPIRFAPAPSELVRTLVGRVEILSQPAERELLTNIESTLPNKDFDTWKLGRFGEPMLWRARKLATKPEVKAYIDELVGNVPQ